MTTVVVSGYFNPLHKGHIDLFKEAKKLGDKLIVIINNDKQVEIKGSKKFMDEKERKYIVESILYNGVGLLYFTRTTMRIRNAQQWISWQKFFVTMNFV